MTEPPDLVGQLLGLAREDLAVAQVLQGAEGISDQAASFHALCGHPHKACYADLRVMPT